jgi:charged multivesicular body protein 4
MFLFERAKKAPTPQESITKLRDTIDILAKRELYLEKKAESQVTEARACLSAKNKRGAVAALKKKRLYENQLNSIIAAHDKLEQQVLSIEGAAATMEALNVLKEGAHAMAQMHGNLTVEKVETLMEDVNDQMDVAVELNKAIAQPMGSDALDEDDLLRELADLDVEQSTSNQLSEKEEGDEAPDLIVTPRAESTKTPTPTSTCEVAMAAAL